MGRFEELKGKLEQVAADVTESEDVEREGEVQVERDRAERDADAAGTAARSREAEAVEQRRLQEAARRQK